MKRRVAMTQTLLEKEWITFVIWNSKTFDIAADYLGLNVSTLRGHRDFYHIEDPPDGHYKGPKLSPQEMFDAFSVHLARRALARLETAAVAEAAALAHFVEVKPNGPAITIPLSALLALINQTPSTGNQSPPPPA
jgi:hypothetical protein